MVLLGVVMVSYLALQACAIDAEDTPETLLDKEAFLLRTLSAVVDANVRKLAALKSLLQTMSQGQSQPGADVRLVASLRTYWSHAEKVMSAVPAGNALVSLARRRNAASLPTDADLADAASTLIRLQDTYRLETASLARGELNGVPYTAELSADDCFDLGMRTLKAENFELAETWMEEALFRHDSNCTQPKPDIIASIAYCRYRLGDAAGALQRSQQALTLDADHSMTLQDVIVYQKALGHNEEPAKRQLNNYDEGYKSLCRGEQQLDEATRSTLRCRYAHHGSWFLRLARLKEEEAFLSPRILLYHDVITDSEIDEIRKEAKPKLRQAQVFGSHSNAAYVDPNRSSWNAWLYDDDLPAVDIVSRRAAHMLGLSLANAEALQVGSYSIGGQYQPHVDYARDFELAFSHTATGNRIATALFYMNDVQLGGATVFPELKVTLFPKKGAAAVWFNLHKDGVGDQRTRHAGCPVLAGSKWVSNKWFHERGQEAYRPCGLVQDSKVLRNKRLTWDSEDI